MKPAGLPKQNQIAVVVSNPTDSRLRPFSRVRVLSEIARDGEKFLVEADCGETVFFINPNDLVYSRVRPLPEWFEKALLGRVAEKLKGKNPYPVPRGKVKNLFVGPGRRIFNYLMTELLNEPVAAVNTLIETGSFDKTKIINPDGKHSRYLLGVFNEHLETAGSPKQALQQMKKDLDISESYLKLFLSRLGYDLEKGSISEGSFYILSSGQAVKVLSKELIEGTSFHKLGILFVKSGATQLLVEDEMSWKVLKEISFTDLISGNFDIAGLMGSMFGSSGGSEVDLEVYSTLDGSDMQNPRAKALKVTRMIHTKHVIRVEYDDRTKTLAIMSEKGAETTAKKVENWLIKKGAVPHEGS